MTVVYLIALKLGLLCHQVCLEETIFCSFLIHVPFIKEKDPLSKQIYVFLEEKSLSKAKTLTKTYVFFSYAYSTVHTDRTPFPFSWQPFSLCKNTLVVQSVQQKETSKEALTYGASIEQIYVMNKLSFSLRVVRYGYSFMSDLHASYYLCIYLAYKYRKRTHTSRSPFVYGM